MKTILTKFWSFDQFCHFFWSKKLSLQILSYGYLNEASWWDKFSGAQENFFWRSIGSPKWDFYTKNSQKAIKRWFFIDFNVIYEFFSTFYIINSKKNFDFFWPPSEKNFDNFFSSKISLWVLKRTVLTSWIRFSIPKIHCRSFSSPIRNIFNKRFIYIINLPFSCTERSPMNF